MRNNHILKISVSAASVAIATCATTNSYAQGSNLFPKEIFSEMAVESYDELSAGANSETERTQSNPITLEIGQDNSRGIATLKPNRDCLLDKSCWSLEISVPTDDNSGISNIATLDNLANDFSIGFNMRRSFVSSQRLNDFFDDIDRLCDEVGLQGECGDVELNRKLEESFKKENLNQSKYISNLLNKAKSYWFVNGKVSNREHDYFSLDGDEQSSDEYGTEIEFGISRFVGLESRFSLGVEYQNYHKDGKSVRNCNLVEGSSIFQTCKTLPLGAPIEQESVTTRIEFRKLYENWILSPVVSHDLKTDITGVDIPFYFRGRSDDKVAGGFRVGWRSDEDKVIPSVFISKPL